MWKRLWEWIRKLFEMRAEPGRQESGSRKQDEPPWENPFLFCSRQIIEEILRQKHLDYRSFRPTVIDTDVPNQNFAEEDDVDQVIAQMEEGLNFLEICTDRPEYFEARKEHMEEEYGLIVRLLPKSGDERLYGNMVLDFERNTPLRTEEFGRDRIYLPFQKRRWESLREEETDHGKNVSKTEGKAAEIKEKPGQDDLDINVPIGYNMLAVRVKKNLQRDRDE